MSTLTTALRQLRPALVVVALFTLLCGLAYPVSVWAVSRIDTASAEGSIVRDRAGCAVGSALLATDPQVEPGQPDPFFHARVVGSGDQTDPTAAAMTPGDPAAGAPSHLGPSNPELAEWITLRREVIAQREGVDPDEVPVDAVTGPGSGLDPHISPEYAAIQVDRVARENELPRERVQALVAEHTDGRQLGFLGQPRVRVTELNSALNSALGLTAPGCAESGRAAQG
ncbi:potassium-transporting ATPase subunit C [Dietzia sp. CQ4]|uniref:potassium-transporting ATPase subunit C n=1 Tax=Dietzia sp. (strain CQ4) TaxID=370437 RepID=UPI0015F85F98|nr:potassium-transporting ATPase subunit C [Dietzia sp. CQ4]MBB1035714.1 potassium-transporting ATPase subunit C [Dietzia sp. CQ4]